MQHDYVINNAPGAALRADLNSVLQAIVTNNSGSVEPSPTFPNMLWYDTSEGVLKKRTNADDAWEVLPSDLATQAEAESGVVNNKFMSPLRVLQSIVKNIPTTVTKNIALLAFRLAVQGALTIMKFVDGIVDEFEDETGIDTAASTESYDSSDHSYGPKNIQNVGGTALSSGDGTSTEDMIPVMTAKTLQGFTVDGTTDPSALTDLNQNSWPWRACDGLFTPWYTDYAAVPWPNYLLITCPTAQIAKSYTIKGYGNYFPDGAAPKSWTFDGSNDGTNWTTIDTQTSVSAWSANEKRSYSVTNTTAYKYYRWNVTDGIDHTRGLYVDEFEILSVGRKENAFDGWVSTWWKSSGTVNGTAYIGYDLGSAKAITGWSIKQRSAALGVTSVKLQYSDNGSSWSDMATQTITADTTKQSFTISSPASHRYWRILANSTTTDGDWAVTDVEFTLPENMILISETQTAETQPDEASLVIFEEDVDAVTINTDLKAYVSRDDGTTWTEATLSDDGYYETSKRILSATVDISAQPSGTSMRYKLVSANLKDFKIHGVSLSWK